MNPQALNIERLACRFHCEETPPAGRCEQWLDALGDADGAALVEGLTAPEEWLLIRRLPLALQWSREASDASVLLQWQQALRRALQAAVAEPGSPDVVRYANRRTALCDVLYRSALGETARQWAWQQMGLIPRADLAPAAILRYAARQLLAEPEHIWPVLHALIVAESDTAALSAVLRKLPGEDWWQLLRACPRSAGYAVEMHAAADPVPTSMLASPATPAAPELPLSGVALALLQWASTRPQLARVHFEVLGVLLATLTWPANSASTAALRARSISTQRQLRTALREPPIAARRPWPPALSHAPDVTAAANDAAVEARATSAANTPAETTPAPALPAAIEWLATEWGGALFWLARVPATGLLDWAGAQPAAELGLQHALLALGAALGIPTEDPGLRAFCGGEVPDAAPPLPQSLRDLVAARVMQWSAWLDEHAALLPEPRLQSVCRRRGRLRFEAGWIDLHLPLRDVDVEVRRLGLDLTPGWLPWLGCVLRIVYDE